MTSTSEPAESESARPESTESTESAGSTGSTQSTEGSRTTRVAAHAATWASAFLILRIFAVSGYDWDTAFLVSTTLGLDDGLALVFGSLMAGRLLTAVLLAGLLPLLIAAYVWGPAVRRPAMLLQATLALATLAALTESFHSWWLPIASVAVLAGLVLLQKLATGDRARRVTTQILARVGGLAGVAVLLVAALVQTPWVPYERIVTTEGTVSGYVLSVEPGYLNVLTDEHEFVIVLSRDVLSRT